MIPLLALALVLLLGTQVLAQVRYKDSEGTMHWVNSLNDVPQEYRPGAVGRPVQPTKPSSTLDEWEMKAREIDRQRELDQQKAERQAEQDAAARRARQEGQRIADEQYRLGLDQQRGLQQAAQERQAAWSRAAEACREVGRQTDSRFDAYVSGQTSAQMIGAPRANFSFGKCMRDAGFDVQ